ncbi:HEPN domain-containing protein [Candidatus Pacearchaeota archaeon]|nr:HEPN domain-containing protein [Candidatus Pacearchaeota archaeon]
MEEKYLIEKIEEAKKNATFAEREREKELAELQLAKSDKDMLSARIERLVLKDKDLRKNIIIKDYSSWDWVIIKSYYAMYHSVLSLLAKLGIQTKTHYITMTAFELFFIKKKIISEKYLNIFKIVKESAKISDVYLGEIKEVRQKRFTANYDVEASIQEKEADYCLELAEDFLKEMKRVFQEI